MSWNTFRRNTGKPWRKLWKITGRVRYSSAIEMSWRLTFLILSLQKIEINVGKLNMGVWNCPFFIFFWGGIKECKVYGDFEELSENTNALLTGGCFYDPCWSFSQLSAEMKIPFPLMKAFHLEVGLVRLVKLGAHSHTVASLFGIEMMLKALRALKDMYFNETVQYMHSFKLQACEWLTYFFLSFYTDCLI